ncbi:MAG TPA: DUF1569 domain-containing protein [Ferruginibacter sp.]|nr:DUF1569 domain-containing protein [Ferruginibacter sp.]
MQEEKLEFINSKMFELLASLPEGSKGLWGKMNSQHMVEHVRDFFNVSIEQMRFGLVTPEEHLPKYKEFLLSDKQFRENTKAPPNVLGEEPMPLRFNTFNGAVDALRKTVDQFNDYFNNNPGKKSIHPVFGPLDFEEWVQLHYKHITHHFRQFGILPRHA